MGIIDQQQPPYHSNPAQNLRNQFPHLRQQLRNAEGLCDHFVHPCCDRRINLLASRIRRDGDYWDVPQDLAAQLFLTNVSNAGQSIHCWHLQIQENNGQRSRHEPFWGL
jgi:hypothetical protein